MRKRKENVTTIACIPNCGFQTNWVRSKNLSNAFESSRRTGKIRWPHYLWLAHVPKGTKPRKKIGWSWWAHNWDFLCTIPKTSVRCLFFWKKTRKYWMQNSEKCQCYHPHEWCTSTSSKLKPFSSIRLPWMWHCLDMSISTSCDCHVRVILGLTHISQSVMMPERAMLCTSIIWLSKAPSFPSQHLSGCIHALGTK